MVDCDNISISGFQPSFVFIISSSDGSEHAEPVGVSPAFAFGTSYVLFSAAQSLFQMLTTWLSVFGPVVACILCMVSHL